MKRQRRRQTGNRDEKSKKDEYENSQKIKRWKIEKIDKKLS